MIMSFCLMVKCINYKNKIINKQFYFTVFMRKFVMNLKTYIMRKVTQNAVNSFLNAQKFREGSTTVEVLDNVTILKLHDNPIAYKYNDPQRTLSITNAGWQTNTTKERLNAIPNVNIKQVKGIWYLNSKAWDGKLIDIN